MLAENLTILKH